MQECIWVDSRGLKVLGILEYAKSEDRGKRLVVFFHGFTGTKSGPQRMFKKVSENLLKYGYTVLRFDFIGSGDSEGHFEDMTISKEIEDALNVLKYCNDSFNIEKKYIIGFSLGGCIATIISSKIQCDGLVLWSPVSNPFWNFYNIFGNYDFMRGIKGENVDFDGNVVGANFFDELAEIDPLKCAANYENKVLLIQGTDDGWIFPSNAYSYKKMFKNCTLSFVEGANHNYTSANFERDLIGKTIDYFKHNN